MRMRALPLAKALTVRGHSVTVLLPPWQNPEASGEAWTEDGVHIENVVLPRDIPGWIHWRLTARLVRRARQLEPDVIHTFKPKAYAGLVHLALAGRYPIVVDTDDWEGPGGWNEIGDYLTWMQRVFGWQERWGLAHADAVTVASRALQTLAWSKGGKPDRVFYLPNGVVPPAYEIPAHVLGRPTLLLYTRFFEYDLGRLWRILQRVRQQRPEVRLVVVGKGFHGEEGRLMRMARESGWRVVEAPDPIPEADLVYVGWGTPENLPTCFATADLGLYPFDDTLLNRTKCPVKLLDLLAAGVPVVADAVGQIPEIIVDGVTGALVPPGDETRFAAAILALLSDGARVQRMRSAAQADIASRYGWDRLAPIAETAYQYARSSR
jgi:glycosyltransferase involved in cell wall biosynthesis